jgi:glycosyltransferase involved in cell wall biosynthesis
VTDKLARKTVVVFGSYAPSLILFRAPLIRELVDRGYRVLAAAPAIDSEVKRKVAALGAEAIEVPISNQSMNPFSARRSLKAMTRLFRDERPEAVISYTIKPVTLGSIAAARAGVPRIAALVTGLGFAFTEGRGLKRRLSAIVARNLYRRAFRRCTAILFQNPDDRDHFRALGLLPADRPITIVNGSGIDLVEFAPVPLPSRPIFLMIARLLGDKGVREYGAAAIRLKRDYPQASFRLAGYFDQSPDAISRAELDEMIAGGVEFIGRLDDVRPAIAECSVYVLPSYREGTPRSVLEAMAMGRPIVTTDAPGCRETVEEARNGFLVPPRIVEPLASAMERFIVEPASIAGMGAQSRALAERKYDSVAVSRAVVEATGL